MKTQLIQLREQLRRAWLERAPHERIILAALTAIIVAVLYVWFLQASSQARAKLGASVAQLRSQAILLEAQARELVQLRALPAQAVSTKDLRTQVQARITDAGLARVLVSIDAPDPDRVKVVFGSLPFADWLAWVVSLQAQHIRLEECRIEALTGPGLVAATATFARAKP